MGIFDKIANSIEGHADWNPCPECQGTEFRSAGRPRNQVVCEDCGHEMDRNTALGAGDVTVELPGDSIALERAGEEERERAESLVERAQGVSVTVGALLKNRGFLGSLGAGKPIIAHLDDGEHPHYIINGNTVDVEGGGDSSSLVGNDRSRKVATGASPVATVVTDRRVFVLVPQMTGNDVRNIPYDSITGIDIDSGIVNKRLSLQTHGRTYHLSGWHSSKNEVNDAMEYIRQRRESVRLGQTKSPAAHQSDPFDTLEKLQEMVDKGIITDEEFAAKKSDILEDL